MHVIDIKRVGDRWVRWIVVRDPDASSRRYWNGRKWVRGLRYARLYTHLRSVMKDIDRACAER